MLFATSPIVTLYLLVSWLTSHHVLGQEPRVFFKIPNPFGINEASSGGEKTPPPRGYYHIKSLQSSIAHKQKQIRTEVEEYFSLELGLSYSLHRDRDSPEASAYAIIGDGPRGRTYLVRDADQSLSLDQIDCELDHLHNHRQVFPWQYVYDLPSADSTSGGGGGKKKKRDKWSNKGTIYGVGAIWLNAIERQLISDQVSEHSFYSDSNSWAMVEGDVTVKMLFHKPESHNDGDIELTRRLVAKSSLSSVRFGKTNPFKQEEEYYGKSIEEESISLVHVQEFQSGLSAATEPPIKRFLKQLDQCRKNTKRHRVFPSLIKALALSPERMYALEYVATRFGQMRDAEDPRYSREHHRYLHKTEIISEWFSYKREAQATVYESLAALVPRDDTGSNQEEDTTQPDLGRQIGPPADWGQVDVFIKKFTFHEQRMLPKDGTSVDETKPLRTTAHFHLVESSAGELVSCKAGESEAPPSWFHLLSRPMHFKRYGHAYRLQGRLDGLGALLMNAAELHYKEFGLFQRYIMVVYDPANPELRVNAKVDEWRLLDKFTDRSVHFYFRAQEKIYENHDISDLLRIDIRDTKATKSKAPSSINDEDVPQTDAELAEDESNLLMRYDIISLMTDPDPEIIESMFSVPYTCTVEAELDATRLIDQELEKDEEEQVEPVIDEDKFKEDGGKSDTDVSQTDSQLDGEEFEFDPSSMLESFQFPDFFDFLDGRAAYSIASTIVLDPSEDKKSERIHLYEQVDLEKGMARYSVFYSEEKRAKSEPDLEFIVHYNSELVFRIERDKEAGALKCAVKQDVDPWLRLFSTDVEFFKRAEGSERVFIEGSNRLRLYGIGALWQAAAESDYEDFAAMQRDVIERKDGKFREVTWSLTDDGDEDFILYFDFLYNQTRYEQDAERVGDANSFAQRRPSDLMQLKTISSLTISDLLGDSILGTKFRDFKVLSASGEDGVIELADLEPDAAMEELPPSCQVALVDYNANVKPAFTHTTSRIITFYDYISPVNAYEAHYTVSHSEPGDSKLSVTQLTEFYDRDANRGRILIGFGSETRTVFIEGGQKRMYEYSEDVNKCKRITSLKGLVDAESGFLPDATSDELGDGKYMVGLAGLWNRICKVTAASGDKVTLEIKYQHEPNGNRVELRNYRFWGEVQHAKKVSYLIEMNFVAQPAKVMDKTGKATANGQQLKLKKIQFTPRIVRSNMFASTQLHRTTIEVGSIDVKRPLPKWDLPDVCAALDVGGDSGADIGDNEQQPSADDVEFPKLTELIKKTGQFYMRSEVTSSVPLLSDEIKLFTLDEWLYNGNLRIKSHGLKKNFDVLIYGDTNEYFDVGTPYVCPKLLPLFPGNTRRAKGPGLMELWGDAKSLPESLSSLYYGPVSLWRLAEKNSKYAKLANYAHLAPKGDQEKRGKASVLESMQMETWQVESPPDGKSGTWTFKLHFYKASSPDKTRQWHILRRIDLTEPQQPDVPVQLGREATVEVINYAYRYPNIAEKFTLPEGYGCLRSVPVQESMGKVGDRLDVDFDRPYSLWYEASLELLEAAKDESTELGSIELNKKIFPSISGTIIKGYEYRSSYWMDLRVFYQKTRYLDGSQTSSKIVYDRPSSLRYDIDRDTGFCKIGQQTSTITWTLDFPHASTKAGDDRRETVVIDDRLFMLLIGSPNAQPLYTPTNRYVNDRVHVSIYEHCAAELKLGNNLVGPATIIRRYESPLNAEQKTVTTVDEAEISTKQLDHSGLTVRVLLFDAQRSTLKATLNLVVRKASNIGLGEVIADSNVARCYKDGDSIGDKEIRTFAIDYSLRANSDLHLNKLAPHHIPEIQRSVIRSIIFSADITPLQLDGPPMIEFSHREGLIRATFSLLEAPTAIEYSVTRWHESRMTVDLESKSEMVLASSVVECSKWCDKLDCIAMSYCHDRTCRLLTMTEEQRQNGIKVSDLSRLTLCTSDPDCTYFDTCSSGKHFQTLEKFADNMDLTINLRRDKRELSDYWLSITYDRYAGSDASLDRVLELVEPVRFLEVHDDLEYIREDTVSRATTSFKILAENRKLESSSLESLKEYTVSVSHDDFGKCLDTCLASADCTVVSYCKLASTCLAVSGRNVDIRVVNALSEPASSGEDCSIVARDYLTQYQKFANTNKPANYEKKLTGYTALECASLCEAASDYGGANDFTCLSFDSCTPERDPSLATLAPLIEGSGFNADNDKTVCYLQKMHVMLDSFDRGVLAPKWHDESREAATGASGGVAETVANCDHYSKSVLGDYQKVPNRALTMVFEQVVRGFSPDRCAIDCRLDDQCLAFEYCLHHQYKPSQACQFIRMDHIPEELADGNKTSAFSLNVKDIEEKLKISDKCTIYLQRHAPELYGLDKDSHFATIVSLANQVAEQHGDALHHILTTLFYILIAIIVGSLIQFLYIRLIGQPLMFNSY